MKNENLRKVTLAQAEARSLRRKSRASKQILVGGYGCRVLLV